MRSSRRVGDELPLRGDRFVQRGQHGAEGRAEPSHLVPGPVAVRRGEAETGGEVAGLGDVLGGRGELGDGPQNAARGQPRRSVGYARRPDGERGEQQRRVAQRAVVGVGGPARAHQAGVCRAGHRRGVDPELMSSLVHGVEVRRLRALGYRDVVAVERPELSRLAYAHRAEEQLEFHAADSDRRAEVGLALTRAHGLFDALGDTGGLLGGVDKGRVDAGVHARGVHEVQHAADRGDDDQHTDRRRHRDPVPQCHGASRRT